MVIWPFCVSNTPITHTTNSTSNYTNMIIVPVIKPNTVNRFLVTCSRQFGFTSGMILSDSELIWICSVKFKHRPASTTCNNPLLMKLTAWCLLLNPEWYLFQESTPSCLEWIICLYYSKDSASAENSNYMTCNKTTKWNRFSNRTFL